MRRKMADIALAILYADNDVTDETSWHSRFRHHRSPGNNGIGVAECVGTYHYAPKSRIPNHVEGTLQDDDAAAAIIYAADNGCNVVNMSGAIRTILRSLQMPASMPTTRRGSGGILWQYLRPGCSAIRPGLAA
jgi:hypothetical protein